MYSNSRPHYGRLLSDHARKHGDMLEYSEPQLVNGGLAPLPCRGLLGTKCFMVIISVNDLDFFGFGPSAILATHYAEKDAYMAITAQENNGEQMIDIPHTATDDVSDNIDTNSNSNSSILHVTNTNNNDEVSNLCEADLVSTGMSTNLCALPTETVAEQKSVEKTYILPQTIAELNTVLETPPPVGCQQPDAISWGGSYKGNVIDTLFEVAKKRGIYDISFSYKKVGPKHSKLIIFQAYGGGFSFEGRHFRQYVAKCEAAAKLLEALSQLPEQVPYIPVQHPLSPGSCLMDSLLVKQVKTESQGQCIIKEDPCVQSQDKSQNFEQEAGKLAPIVPSKRQSLLPFPTSPAEPVGSDVTQKSSIYSSNPVGYLNELLAKEHSKEPVYVFSSKAYGVYEEYTCKVTLFAKDLSAEGVGLCKKSCKKRAAANLLSLMELKGMNIHFDRCFAKKKNKKVSCSGAPTGARSPLLHPRRVLHLPLSPLLSVSPHEHSRASWRERLPPFVPPGPRPSYAPLPSRWSPHITRSSKSVVHPSHPTHPHNAHEIPPQSAYIQSYRGQMFSTDSESDSDCGQISLGLQEIIPLSCSEKNSEIAQLSNTFQNLSVDEDSKYTINSINTLEATSKKCTANTSSKRDPTVFNHQHIAMHGVKIAVKDTSNTPTSNKHSIYSKNASPIVDEQPQSAPSTEKPPRDILVVKEQPAGTLAAKEQSQSILGTKEKPQNQQIYSPCTKPSFKRVTHPSIIFESDTSDTDRIVHSSRVLRRKKFGDVTKGGHPQCKIKPRSQVSELCPTITASNGDKAVQKEVEPIIALSDEDKDAPCGKVGISSNVTLPSHTVRVGHFTQLPRHPLLASFTSTHDTTSTLHESQSGLNGRQTDVVSVWKQSVSCL